VPDAPPTLTEQARAALRDAEREARDLNHDAVGQEHLLLALTRADGSLALRVLAALEVDLERLRTTIATMVPRRVVPPTAETLPQTPRLQAALRLAGDEARGFEHPTIGTDHLLLGVLRERTGIGAAALDLLGVTLNKARHETLELRHAGATESGGPIG
jgi:ATP-dependent Clp protease ATP-binding subunit ClpC